MQNLFTARILSEHMTTAKRIVTMCESPRSTFNYKGDWLNGTPRSTVRSRYITPSRSAPVVDLILYALETIGVLEAVSAVHPTRTYSRVDGHTPRITYLRVINPDIEGALNSAVKVAV